MDNTGNTDNSGNKGATGVVVEQLKKPQVAGGVAFVIGLIFGLVVLGWGLWPVQWTDASANELRPDLQEQWLRMAIDSYTLVPNEQQAVWRYTEMGSAGPVNLAIVKANPGTQNPASIAEFEKIATGGVTVPVATPAAGTTPAAGQTLVATVAGTAQALPTKAGASNGVASNLTGILALMCLLTLVIAGILVYLFVFRNRQGTKTGDAGATIPRTSRSQQIAEPTAEPGQETPVVQYLTTYSMGNDLYDDSISIDSPTGEFLGECGVGISETIGVGDPKKVTAFEVWLFDKNDIQTVTKVLMSTHAFTDPTISQRLASKGEPVQADPGKRIVLETATLQLEARVVSMTYGQGALPANSYFEQLTLELAVWPKPAVAQE